MNSKTWAGGLLIGRLDPDVLLEISEVGVSVFHFAHGKLCIFLDIENNISYLDKKRSMFLPCF